MHFMSFGSSDGNSHFTCNRAKISFPVFEVMIHLKLAPCEHFLQFLVFHKGLLVLDQQKGVVVGMERLADM